MFYIRVAGAFSGQITVQKLGTFQSETEKGYKLFAEVYEALLGKFNLADDQAKNDLNNDANANETPTDRLSITRKRICQRNDEENAQ